jgi:predicted dehydrogenase
MKPLRLGIVGCGGMSKNFAATFASVGPGLAMTAAVDIDPDRAQDAANLFPGARAATDYRTVLDDVDAVLLVLPHHLHHEVGLACLQAGKHVLLEKPMANSETECLDLIAAAARYRRVLMIAYVMRFHPLVVRLKELLDRRTYGDCFQLSIWTEQYTEYPPDHWSRSAQKLGGGQLFSHGCHYIDLLLWFLSDPVEGTHIGSNFGTPWMEREGTSNVCLRFENGALGYHFGTWGARGTRLRYTIHAHCTAGMLEIDFDKGALVFHRDAGTAREEVLMQSVAIKQTDKELRHFLDCIRHGQRPDTDGPRSLQSLRVIWRLYEAEQQGRVADLRGLGLERATGSSSR